MRSLATPNGAPAIPSNRFVTHHRHPARRPSARFARPYGMILDTRVALTHYIEEA